MDDSLIEKVARAIMLKMQMKDFGRALPTGDFETSTNQIDALEAASREAARAAIEAYEKAVGNLVKIDAVAMSRAMAIAGIKASTQDAEMTAEALRNLTKYHHLG